MEALKPLSLYTDGSCLTQNWENGGPGGWAYLVDGNMPVAGSAQQSTSTTMEIVAAISGLAALPYGSVVNLFTDCLTIDLILSTHEGGQFSRGRAARKMKEDQRLLWLSLVEAAERHNLLVRYLDAEARKLPQHAEAVRAVHKAAKAQAGLVNDRLHKERMATVRAARLKSARPKQKQQPRPMGGLKHARECEYGRCVNGCPVWGHYGAGAYGLHLSTCKPALYCSPHCPVNRGT